MNHRSSLTVRAAAIRVNRKFNLMAMQRDDIKLHTQHTLSHKSSHHASVLSHKKREKCELTSDSAPHHRWAFLNFSSVFFITHSRNKNLFLKFRFPLQLRCVFPIPFDFASLPTSLSTLLVLLSAIACFFPMAQAKAEREKTNKIKEMERMDRSGDDDGEVSKKKRRNSPVEKEWSKPQLTILYVRNIYRSSGRTKSEGNTCKRSSKSKYYSRSAFFSFFFFCRFLLLLLGAVKWTLLMKSVSFKYWPA